MLEKAEYFILAWTYFYPDFPVTVRKTTNKQQKQSEAPQQEPIVILHASILFCVFSSKHKETKQKTVFQVSSALLRLRCVAKEQDPQWPGGWGQTYEGWHRQRGMEGPKAAPSQLKVSKAHPHCSLLSTFLRVVWFQRLCLAFPQLSAAVRFPSKLYCCMCLLNRNCLEKTSIFKHFLPFRTWCSYLAQPRSHLCLFEGRPTQLPLLLKPFAEFTYWTYKSLPFQSSQNPISYNIFTIHEPHQGFA